MKKKFTLYHDLASNDYICVVADRYHGNKLKDYPLAYKFHSTTGEFNKKIKTNLECHGFKLIIK